MPADFRRASSIKIFFIASSALVPQANGACPPTNTAGMVPGSSDLNRSTITEPVFSSYLLSTSFFVRNRVTGIGPLKWSACVVPRQGISLHAWANIVAYVLWACAIPPMLEKFLYNRRWVGRSEDGRNFPSTILPSKSTKIENRGAKELSNQLITKVLIKP